MAGLDPVAALLIMSNCALAAAFLLAAVYVRQRGIESRSALTDYVLLAMGLMPATLFFRMAYSESLFLLLCIVCLLGMTRRWPLFVTALIVGLATAVRPVGMGLLAPFVLHCLHRSSTRWRFVLNIAYLVPVACWYAGYALYQGMRFGDPFAFVKAQSHWGLSSVPLSEKLTALLAFEPIWQVYDSGSPYFWAHRQPYPLHPLFCWTLVNPLYFVVSAILIIIGDSRALVVFLRDHTGSRPFAHPLLQPGLRDGHEFTR